MNNTLRSLKTSPAHFRRLPAAKPEVVNDVHAQLNATRVRRVVAPRNLDELCGTLREARAAGLCVAVSGGRHAMGGQQFGTGALQLDMRRMNRVLKFDPEKKLIEVEAGINWVELIAHMVRAQNGANAQLAIRQKQSGADNLTVGGSLAANIHGRGLTLRPFVDDIESLALVDGDGQERVCSRAQNAEMFKLCVGGYGLFGVVTRVTLRLAARQKLERVVDVVALDELSSLFEKRIAEGYLYGDFQYSTDHASPDFLRRGIFSCYKPADDDAQADGDQRELSADAWRELIHLAHVDRARAFEIYARHYLQTSGQIYWSDTHQLSVYLADYHHDLNRRLGRSAPAGEMITECYVPRDQLTDFMEQVRREFLRHRPELIYGTVRLILRDEETFLAWAKKDYACVIFNLHVEHTASAIAAAKFDFRRLIHCAIACGGSYYLTYHRWATTEQVLTCYPQLPEFLRHKKRHDPAEVFQSDWYRYYRFLSKQ